MKHPTDDIRFYRDTESGLAHCFVKHGIHERDVIEVVRQPGQRFRNKDDTIVSEGQTHTGRYLRVIHRQYSDYIFVITAYDMSGTVKRAYRRRRRHK